MTFAKTFKRGDRVEDARITGGMRGTFCRMEDNGANAVIAWDGLGQHVEPMAILRHAPVTVIGPTPPKAPTDCPQCGQRLSVDHEAIRFTPRQGAVPQSKKVVSVAACGFCDFLTELPR